MESALEQIRSARRRGELFEAYDLAVTARDSFEANPDIAYEAVLCLARAGATELAHRRYHEFGLSPELGLDHACLIARIEKDEALSERGEERRRRLHHAAEAYRDAYLRYGSSYPAINAATLYLLAGDEPRAQTHARLALSHLPARHSAADFWDLATEAEAALILDDRTTAEQAIAAAMALPGLDLSAVASTRRQLRLVAAARDLGLDLLAPLAPPMVVHFTGHRIAAPGAAGRFPADLEAAAAALIAEAVTRHRVAFGHGSLASGADILFAEAILAAGGEVHAVLPFSRDDFIAQSVADSGEDWCRRFDRLLASPKVKISAATSDPFLGDAGIFNYTARYAMGLAVMKAKTLGAEVLQLALWDGAAARGAAGTAQDVALWRDQLGRPTEVLWPLDTLPAAPSLPEPAPVVVETADQGEGEDPRVLRALLFCDIANFSHLDDTVMPRFVHHVMGRLGRVVREAGAAVLLKNTWGDAIHAVLGDAAAAAALALALQDEMAAIDLAALGLPSGLALRVGCHMGPVYSGYDPVTGRPTVYGAAVTRCARIEPIAFTGKVFVSEAFAAELALASGAFACEYVGTIPTAKNFGRMPMYLLRRRGR